jgi:hypothetical protein
MLLQSVVVIIIFGHSHVYRERRLTAMEYFNEFTVLVCVYHYFCFTLFVDSSEVRYLIGYSLIAVTLFNIAVNVIVILLQTILKGAWDLRKFYYKVKRMIRRRKILKNQLKIRI